MTLTFDIKINRGPPRVTFNTCVSIIIVYQKEIELSSKKEKQIVKSFKFKFDLDF